MQIVLGETNLSSSKFSQLLCTVNISLIQLYVTLVLLLSLRIARWYILKQKIPI
jgi:hypothetical protein